MTTAEYLSTPETVLPREDDVIEVVRFEEGRIASRRVYGPTHRLQSVVLPDLTATVEEMVG